MQRFFLLILTVVSIASCSEILIEAESFNDKGGWSLDNQSVFSLGSSYLLAHGLGHPVKDAVTEFDAPAEGEYNLWVKTKDWTATWGRTEAPGRFEVLVNGEKVAIEFGTEGKDWHWQNGGKVLLKKGANTLQLHDLTGFEGRCDAIYFSKGSKKPAENLRAKPQTPVKIDGDFDLIVAGGGIGGCCAAITAARLGCKVALVQNRPVLGGNNSSEVRVGLSGRIYKNPYPKLGGLMDELGGVGHHVIKEAEENPGAERSKKIMEIVAAHPEKRLHNAGPASIYEDDKKLALIKAEENITLFLNTEVTEVKMDGDRICGIIGENIEDGSRICLTGKLFADCTGDGVLGYLAGADYRVGRESKAETGEASALDVADSLTMGTSVQWYAVQRESAVAFPECPWALQFDENTCQKLLRGDWDWEAGLDKDQIAEIEYVRDHALRAVYGNWAYLKNHCEGYEDKELEWVAYIGGKRESRRLLGDYILKEEDILQDIKNDDDSFTTTWEIDLHYPQYLEGFSGEPFLARCEKERHEPHAVPYRCLYSRNVSNLFMAGRDISVTHIALGSVRVMRTIGMMGEVVGMAADICRRNETLPRGVYQDHLPELKSMMTVGAPRRFPDFW